jgi:hypothetical protein
MTTEPVINIELFCDRTEKSFTVSVPLSKYRTFLEYHHRRAGTVSILEAQLQTPQSLPDMAIIFRGRAVILPTVNPKQDALIGRLLNAATNTTVFPVTKRTRKKKDSK